MYKDIQSIQIKFILFYRYNSFQSLSTSQLRQKTTVKHLGIRHFLKQWIRDKNKQTQNFANSF